MNKENRNHARKVEYCLQQNGEFLIKNYDLAKPFASFFPGIAGLFGIPMWIFYVNRGQGIISFGTQDKNHAIAEFYPANRAWQLATLNGFRTFVKFKRDKEQVFYEPFQNNVVNHNHSLERDMYISANELRLTEHNKTVGLYFDVDYFTLSNEPLACLIRNSRIKNVSSAKISVEVIDGLPQIVPYGVSNKFLKKLGRTIEAWMKVDFVTKYKVPFYKLVVDPTDRPQVIYVQGGNFYYSFLEKGARQEENSFIFDPQVLFGPVNDFNYPQRFFEDKSFIATAQAVCNKTPSAFGYAKADLNPGEEIKLVSFVGYSQDEKHLEDLVFKVRQKDYLKNKAQESRQTVEKLENHIFTASSDTAYNLYCRQTFLDNVLRGGFPLTFARHGTEPYIFHVFSRKHGDLERDYNSYLTEATYFSQGNGNYRDVYQNRRCDTWFNPDVKEQNIMAFFNLLQLDGFNPLVVFGVRFMLKDKNKIDSIADCLKKRSDLDAVISFIEKQFAPGNLFMFLEEKKIKLKTHREKFLDSVLSVCGKLEHAEHGDGFWIDHWTYNMDALEALLAIYPEDSKELMFDKKVFVYFNNFVKVKPRAEKYVLFEGRARQYHAVTIEEIEEDSKISKKIKSEDWAVRVQFGAGDVYRTSLLGKMVCLITNKMASFDPFGCGIEMEANKPGWYDALNGLPALFGSSSCETMELKRLVGFVIVTLNDAGSEQPRQLALYEELYEFLMGLKTAVKEYLGSGSKDKDMIFWNRTGILKEIYRHKVNHGISGAEKSVSIIELKEILNSFDEKLDISVNKAKDKKTGLYCTYYINEVIEYEKITDKEKKVKLSKDGLICIHPKKFKQIPLPLFLEAQVHALRISGKKSAQAIYAASRRSALYDKPLKMFKVNASLKSLSEEIGRARIFTPGWLENESVWLHMEYKFLLELLRNELYEEFFSEFKNILIPFQPPARYGRSTLENSSFLVSSAYPESSLHGNGFVARLSGSTAELLNIWLWMNAGKTPFRLDRERRLFCELKPVLPSWLFLKNKSVFDYYRYDGTKTKLEFSADSYAFNFLSNTLVVYHNPKKKHTYGKNAAKIKQMILTGKNGEKFVVNGSIIALPHAQVLREGGFVRIDVTLG